MSLIGLLLTLCGCKPSARLPEPGVDQDLRYPVILFGGNKHRIVVRDEEERLTTTRNSEGSVTFFEGSRIVDSAGNLYRVESVRIASKVQSWPADATGNSPHRVALRLRSEGTKTLEEVKRLLTEVVRHPKSLWSELTHGNAVAVKQINAAPTLEALIEECRDPYAWLR